MVLTDLDSTRTSINYVKEVLEFSKLVIEIVILISPFLVFLFRKLNSWLFRKQKNIPQIMGTKWKAIWYLNDGLDDSTIQVAEDTVTIKKWTYGGKFKAEGAAVYHHRDGKTEIYKYPISGEISPQRIMVIDYKAEKYPAQGNIGVACMELDVSGREFEGYWSGRASVKTLDGTKVIRIRNGKVNMKIIE